MTRSAKANDPVQLLRSVALQYPEVHEGIACAGTALEKRTIKARNKAFVFLGATDAMLKVGTSLPELTELAAQEPNRYKVGTHGWATVTFGDVETLPLDRLTRWLDESYRLLAPRQLVALLPEQGPPTKNSRTTPQPGSLKRKGP